MSSPADAHQYTGRRVCENSITYFDRGPIHGACSIAEKLVGNEELVRIQLLENGYSCLYSDLSVSNVQYAVEKHSHNDIVW